MLISLVVPTIEGREDELARTLTAYARLTPIDIEVLVEHDHPTCASAWNAGAERATGEVLALGNDDLEPETAMWFFAASLTLKNGGVPVGWVREDEAGRFGRDFPRVPICMREWWIPLSPSCTTTPITSLGTGWRRLVTRAW